MDKYLIKKKPELEPVLPVILQNNNTDINSSTISTIEIEILADSSSCSQFPIVAEIELDNPTIANKVKTLSKPKPKPNLLNAWLENPKFSPWLINKENRAFCKVCFKYVMVSGSSYHIKRHAKSAIHIMKLQQLATQSTPSISQLFSNEKNISLHKSVRAAELKMVMFIAENNLPLLLMDKLPQLMQSALPDSAIAKKIKCCRKKSTRILTEIIAPQNVRNISKDILRGQPYSIIVDESTDIGCMKTLAIAIRYFCGTRVRDRFLTMVEVKDLTAQGLFNTLTSVLEENQIPLKNMIGFAADNASIMMGKTGGLQAKLKNILPNLCIFGCICHSFALCSEHACKKLPNFIEEFARDICNHFGRSPVRRQGLEKFQSLLDLEPHKILKLSQTRWLSLEAVVNRILEQWPALILYFEEVSHEPDKYAFKNAKPLYEALQNPINKLYFFFLSYVLNIINKLNIEFQSELPKIHVLYKRMSELYGTILRNFIKKNHLDNTMISKINWYNPSNFLNNDEMYLGSNVEVLISQSVISNVEIKEFKINCLNFYITLCENIRKRFDFDNDLLKFMANFEPNVATSGTVSSIVSVLKIYHNFNIDVEQTNTEWRLIADSELPVEFANKTIEDFWFSIGEIRNEENTKCFANIAFVAKNLLCLPQSSANVERIFSQHNLIKTKLRNRINLNTSNSLLSAKDMLKTNNLSSTEWAPEEELLKLHLSK